MSRTAVVRFRECLRRRTGAFDPRLGPATVKNQDARARFPPRQFRDPSGARRPLIVMRREDEEAIPPARISTASDIYGDRGESRDCSLYRVSAIFSPAPHAPHSPALA